jgi:hypothetical protein
MNVWSKFIAASFVEKLFEIELWLSINDSSFIELYLILVFRCPVLLNHFEIHVRC